MLFIKKYKSFRRLPSLESIDINIKEKEKGKRPLTTNLEISIIYINRLESVRFTGHVGRKALEGLRKAR